jgi:hypothetical protein
MTTYIPASEQHQWVFIFSTTNGNTTDQLDYCAHCGIVRKSYFYPSEHYVNPTYYGVGVEGGTIDQPICYPRSTQFADDGHDRDSISQRIISALESIDQTTKDIYATMPEPA